MQYHKGAPSKWQNNTSAHEDTLVFHTKCIPYLMVGQLGPWDKRSETELLRYRSSETFYSKETVSKKRMRVRISLHQSSILTWRDAIATRNGRYKGVYLDKLHRSLITWLISFKNEISCQDARVSAPFSLFELSYSNSNLSLFFLEILMDTLLWSKVIIIESQALKIEDHCNFTRDFLCRLRAIVILYVLYLLALHWFCTL